MSEPRPSLEKPDETREAIMQATYDALVKHGYADLTIQRIADEFPKSKSLLYHHYEGKDDLLLGFLERMLRKFEDEIPEEIETDADEHLMAIFEYWFRSPFPEENREFWAAIVDLRAQATHDRGYRDYFSESDEFFHEHLVDIIDRGIEQDVFRDVDPVGIATLIQNLVIGVMTHRVTTTDEHVERLEAVAEWLLDDCLLAAD